MSEEIIFYIFLLYFHTYPVGLFTAIQNSNLQIFPKIGKIRKILGTAYIASIMEYINIGNERANNIFLPRASVCFILLLFKL